MTDVLGCGQGHGVTASPLPDARRRGTWVRIAYVVRAFVAGSRSRTIPPRFADAIRGSYPGTPPHPLHLAPRAADADGIQNRARAGSAGAAAGSNVRPSQAVRRGAC